MTTGTAYGIEKMCRVWEQARSTFYARQQQAEQPVAPLPRRRGPRPLIPDDVLLEHIRQDLANSPFRGEGHRKVWARLRFGQGLRVSRKRVLRLMREHPLLSPYRTPQGEPKLHDGSISTAAPNLMRGTDGAKVFTLEDGWVWACVAVEHGNAECVGWHVSKRGDRFAALEPISQGLTNLFGSVAADVARGLSLRMEPGSQYLSDPFVNQVRFWGLTPSFACVAEPETNGVAERFIRTLKEQAIYGQVFRTLAEVRVAVADFVQRYNDLWRVEKNRFVSPKYARENWLAHAALRAAA